MPTHASAAAANAALTLAPSGGGLPWTDYDEDLTLRTDAGGGTPPVWAVGHTWTVSIPEDGDYDIGWEEHIFSAAANFYTYSIVSLNPTSPGTGGTLIAGDPTTGDGVTWRGNLNSEAVFSGVRRLTLTAGSHVVELAYSAGSSGAHSASLIRTRLSATRVA